MEAGSQRHVEGGKNIFSDVFSQPEYPRPILRFQICLKQCQTFNKTALKTMNDAMQTEIF